MQCAISISTAESWGDEARRSSSFRKLCGSEADMMSNEAEEESKVVLSMVGLSVGHGPTSAETVPKDNFPEGQADGL